MSTLHQTPCWQLERFLSALFLPQELIELRFIESWVLQGKKTSRVVRPARWLLPRDFVSSHGELTAFAKRTRANIYFGVCPRSREGDADDQSIEIARCVWCDIDSVTVNEAHKRWRTAGIPGPSIVVSSGAGVHGYWLLEQDLKSPVRRSQLAATLPEFYRSFGGDHVQNVSRVLRPPGTLNYKDARNGRLPLPCTLHSCRPRRRYPLETFFPWLIAGERAARRETAVTTPQRERTASAAKVFALHRDAQSLVRRLDVPSHDRSRRDFAIICDLLRLGLTTEEIWSIVQGSSKFESNGRRYFDHTIANARRSVLSEPADRRQQSASS